MFAVNPKRDCPHVHGLDYAAFSKKAIDINAECEAEDCHHSGENWICCFCGSVLCSRYVSGHAAEHAEKNPEHCISVSFADCSCWCYKCDSYIDDPISVKFVRQVQRAKFGKQEVPEEAAAAVEAPVRPIILDGAAAETPDMAFKSKSDAVIQIRDVPSASRLLIEDCSKCVIKVLTGISVLQLQKCRDCTIYVDDPTEGIFIHGCINVTVRHQSNVRGCTLGVNDSVGVIVIIPHDPYYAFFSSCEVVNSAVGIKTPVANTVIAETGHSKTSFNREKGAFQTVPVKEGEEEPKK